MARWIRADGQETEVSPHDPVNGFSLREIHMMVGEPIDIVQVPPNLLMVCCDDAYRDNLPDNRKATLIYWSIPGHFPGWWIKGNVLLASTKEVQ